MTELEIMLKYQVGTRVRHPEIGVLRVTAHIDYVLYCVDDTGMIWSFSHAIVDDTGLEEL